MTNKVYKNFSLDDINGEIWRDVVDYEGLYAVSNLGRVKRLARRTGKYKQRLETLIMNQNQKPDGYLWVQLKKDSKPKTCYVHRLVAIAFIPNPLNLPEVHHRNHNPEINDTTNLIWVTKKQNSEYSSKSGRLKREGKSHKIHKKDILASYYKNLSFRPSDEIWVDIIDYNGVYKISNYGRILSINKTHPLGKLKTPTFGKQKLLISGNPLYICLSKNATNKVFLLQRLVAIHFLPNPENLPMVGWIDGNKDNNHVSNLQWRTMEKHRLHLLKIGLNEQMGIDNIHVKLTEKTVLEIRNLAKQGMSFVKLSTLYGVKHNTIANIVKRRSWKHIPEIV